MTYTVHRVTAPDEVQVGDPYLHESEAVERVRALEAEPLPVGVYHEVRRGGRVAWTSEAGELQRLV